MKVLKSIHGASVQLELKKIKEYKYFDLYQVYKIINNKQVLIYQESFTYQQINEIINKKYIIKEEVFE